MKKPLPVFLALGAGLALINVYHQHRRDASVRAWQQGVKTYPGTAAITGASSGIGEVFARALAREGYNLVIMARREERLRALADELQRQFLVNVETLVADLSDPADLERTAVRLAEIPNLTLLINNAGFGTGGKFAEIDVQPELKMIHLHVIASVRLAHAVLPGMIDRHHGGIINVSSVAGLLPMPGNGTYGATKSYLNFFTSSLNSELEGTGVRVEALCPGFTTTEFHDVNHISRSFLPAFLWMRSEDVVADALQGLREGQEIVIPGAIYRLLALLLKIPWVTPLARAVQRLRLQMAA